MALFALKESAITELVGILGAMIGATTALLSQYFTNRQQGRLQAQRIAADRELKEMEFARADFGVRSQIGALASEVGEHVLACRTDSKANWERIRPSLERLLERISEPEVSTALTPSQMQALYAAAASIEWLLKFPPSTLVSSDVYIEPCEKIAFFWHEMDDEIQAQTFKTAATTGRKFPRQKS